MSPQGRPAATYDSRCPEVPPCPPINPTRTEWRHRPLPCTIDWIVNGSRLPLGRAHLLASMVMREVRRAGLPTDHIVPLGSLRRWAPDIGDVSLLAIAEPAAHNEVLDGFLKLPTVTAVLARLPSSVEAATERGRVR